MNRYIAVFFMYLIFFLIIPFIAAYKFLVEVKRACNYTRLEVLIEWQACRVAARDVWEGMGN